MSKWALLSKTIIGILITLAGAFNVPSELIPMDLADTVAQTVDGVITVVGAAIGIWGRFTADKPVTVLPKPTQ